MKSFEPPRPPHRKRYNWMRVYDDFWDHPKWEVVALMTQTHVCTVICVAGRLMRAANRGRPRGSIGEFSVLETAARLRVDPSVVQRIYDCFENLGWIDREYLTTWDERQPDKEREDPTNSERQKRYRERRQAERGVTLRNAQTETKISKKEATVTELESGTALTWDKAEQWLKEHRTNQRELPLYGIVKQRGNR